MRTTRANMVCTLIVDGRGFAPLSPGFQNPGEGLTAAHAVPRDRKNGSQLTFLSIRSLGTGYFDKAAFIDATWPAP